MRIISEHGAIQLLGAIFGLRAPVAFDEVKKKYRELCKKHHPDTGGDAETFKKINEAFNQLNGLYTAKSHLFREGSNQGSGVPRYTTDGTPLENLGKGVAFNQNGVDCEICSGRGYTLEEIISFTRHSVDCPICRSTREVPREFPCRSCNGSGIFKKSNGWKVRCRRCGGSGIFKHPHLKQKCSVCSYFQARVPTPTGRFNAFKCYKCDGVGQIVIENPVIPNGMFQTKK